MPALLALIPLRVWLIAGAIAVGGFLYWKITSDAYRDGAASIVTDIKKGQDDAQNRAEAERRKLDRGDDSGVRGFDRD